MRLLRLDRTWDSSADTLDRAFERWQQKLAHVQNPGLELGGLDGHHVVDSTSGSPIFKLRQGQTNERFFIEVREIDDEHVGHVLAGVTHDRRYDDLHDDGFASLRRRAAAVSDDDLRTAIEREATDAVPARVVPVPTFLRSWIEPLRYIESTFNPRFRVVEDRSWREWAAEVARTDDRLEQLQRQVLEILDRGPGDPVSVGEDGATAHHVGDGLHLRGPGTDASSLRADQVVRSYGVDVLRGAGWVALEADPAPDSDPCLHLDRYELAALTRGSTKLPLLIDGPAGSGKSTLLSYVIATLANRVRDEDIPGRVLLLSSSEELASEARGRVSRHLRVRFGYDRPEAEDVAAAACLTIDALFGELVETTRFPRESKATLHAYLGWAAKRSSPVAGVEDPTTIWWLARAIVRGWSRPRGVDTTPLDAEDLYAELPRDVLDDVARRIGRRLVPEDLRRTANHYGDWLQSTDRWDDADLACAAGDEVVRRAPTVLALAVDEAQDLTRLQLDVLIRLLHQVRKHLRVEGAVSLPLFFAADPHQEINASGFSWDRFRGMLGSVIKVFTGDASIPDAVPLTLNHRSQQRIVQVANRVQELRGLDREQRSTLSAVVDVHVLSLEQQREMAAEVLANTHILLPVFSGEVRPLDDANRLGLGPETSRFLAERTDAGDLLRPRGPAFLQTPFTAKGRAFQAVTLFGYQRACAELDGHLGAAMYVAVTRAERGLVLIEESEAEAASLRARLKLSDAPPPEDLVARLRDIRDDRLTALQAIRRGLSEGNWELLAEAAAVFEGMPDGHPTARSLRALVGHLHNGVHVTPDSLAELGDEVTGHVLPWAVRSGRWDIVDVLPGVPPVVKALASRQRGTPVGFLRRACRALADDPSTEHRRELLLALRAATLELAPSSGGLEAAGWRTVTDALERIGEDPATLSACAWASLHAGMSEEALFYAKEVGPDLLRRVTVAATGIHFLPPTAFSQEMLDDQHVLADVVSRVLADDGELLPAALRDLEALDGTGRDAVVRSVLAAAAAQVSDITERTSQWIDQELRWAT